MRGRTIPSTTTTPTRPTRMAPAAAASHTGHPGAVAILIGVGFLALFTVAFMTQIQTNEAFITNAGDVNIYKPNWAILTQLPNLVTGTLSPAEAAATIFGWGIELIYLGFIVGYELLSASVEQSGHVMAGLFRTLSWGIVAFNWWTDDLYGTLGGGFWGHVGFACMVSFIVGFFGTIGIALIRYGISRW